MSTFVEQWQDWHANRERDLADPYGWLALVSLDWLTDAPATYPAAPGVWWQDTEAAYVDTQGAELSYAGEAIEYTLTAFNGKSGSGLNILFTDATSGVTTYPANRSVVTAEPAADGTVTLDFNRSVNLPCAFTDFATCPLPPEGNHLPFEVTAGELLPYERSEP